LPNSKKDNNSAATYGASDGQSSANLVAFWLMLAYCLSFLDRQILVLMIEPIQRDLNISDTMFSLLHGASFALFYTITGLFLGKIVDTKSRVKIIAFSVFLWSLATAVSGISRSFFQLFLARVFVGVGEAGLSPATYSLLGDLFDAKKRSLAFAIYGAGIYLGTGLAFLLGGKLVGYLSGLPPTDLPFFGEIYSWQIAFFIFAAPGIFLSILFYFFVAEPVRGGQENTAILSAPAKEAAPVSFREFFRHYRANLKPYLGHNLGYGLHMMFSYSFLAWVPAMLMRVHVLEIGEVGLYIGLSLLICGPAGSFSGAALSNYFAKRGVSDSQLRISAIGSLLLGLFGALSAGLDNTQVSIAAAAAAIFFMGLPAGLNGATLQTITPPHFRGQAGASFLLIGNILGLGFGPLLVALLTDYVFSDQSMVHYSLQVFALTTMPLSAILLWRVRSYFAIENTTSDADLTDATIKGSGAQL
jgi:MFS family permease